MVFQAASVQSLYIHWPFCPYKCHFCPFVALAGHDQFMGQYHEALKKELVHFAAVHSCVEPIKTIFFGGGTPSTYPDALLLDMSDTLRKIFIINNDTEITIEVNPGTVRAEQLRLWKQLGISRLSIGVQSLKDDMLKKLNRHQSVQDVYQLLGWAQEHFTNISVDLILGMPEVSPTEWKELLTHAVRWPIKHISMYFLTVHEDTPLYFKVKDQRVQLPCDDEMIDLYYWSIEFLHAHGFHQYEVSNFAQEGFQSRHNTVYWQRKPYKGFGLGACSFDGTRRIQNEKNLLKYMAAADKTGEPSSFSETLTREQIQREKVMLGLRFVEGVRYQDIMEDLHEHEQIVIKERIAWLTEHQFIIKQDDRLKLTPRGLSVEHEIAVKLTI